MTKVKVTHTKSRIQETYRVELPNQTLLEVLQEKSGRSRSAAKKLLASVRVAVDGAFTTRAEMVLKPESVITIHVSAPAKPFSHPLLELIWENSDYVVLYKSMGIPTVNTSHKDRRATALFVLSQHYKKDNPQAKLFMVNRLDRNTAGFVIFAKSIESKDLLVAQWSRLVRSQTFATCVEGEVYDRTFTIESSSEPQKGKRQFITTAEVKLLKSSARGGMHVIEVDVKHARIFSLRKVLGDNGFGIYGDVRSGSSFMTDGKIALQQIRFELVLPETGQRLNFERPFPSHFYTLLKEDR